MMGCVVGCYAYWVATGGEKFLPTISVTWEVPPANYVSRLVVGNVCDMTAAVNGILYFHEQRQRARLPWEQLPRWLGIATSPALLLGLALVGLFCLSWVGAICDSPEPSCMGNNAIHTALAVVFFVCYDVKMLLTALLDRAADARYARPSAALALASAAATVLRVALGLGLTPGLLGADSETLLAIVERTNVWIIAVWTVMQAFAAAKAAPLGYGTVVLSDAAPCAGPRVTALGGMTTPVLSYVVAAFYLGTLFVTAAIGVYQGYLPVVPGQIWFISQMWTTVPGNWISRWGVVQSAHWAAWVQVSLYVTALGRAGGDAAAQAKAKKLLATTLVALFGISVVGICNMDENITVHCLGAYAFFIGYDVYMYEVVESHEQQQKAVGSGAATLVVARRWVAWGSIIGQLASKAFYVLASTQHGAARAIARNFSAGIEWIDTLLIIAFFLFDVQVQQTTMTDIVHGVYVAHDEDDNVGYAPLTDGSSGSEKWSVRRNQL